MKRLLLIALLLLTAAAAAQNRTSTLHVVVPVAGTIGGANNVRWRTSVDLTNEGRSDLDVALTLATLPDQPAILTTIGAGQTVHYADIMAEAFEGMAVGEALSPLLIETNGRLTVHANAYGMRGGDVFTPEPITVHYGPVYSLMRVLQGLSFSDTYRTNIGLVNVSDRSATFTLAAQRLPGRNLAVSRVTLPPNSIQHAPIQGLFPLITKGDDFAVVIECENADTYVYASVVNNETNEGTFIAPQVGAMSLIQ